MNNKTSTKLYTIASSILTSTVLTSFSLLFLFLPSIAAPAKTNQSASQPSHSTSGNTTILRLGSRGEAVKQLQNALKKAGVYKETIDGIFGRETEAAVIKLQQSKKLVADGVVGAKTWAVLR